MSTHPFATWLVKNHAKADTAVGDLARDVRDGLDFPATGERRDLRYRMQQYGADSNFLASFEEAWRLYEPDGSPADHPFVTWLLRQDLRDLAPLSSFAREYAELFPTSGDRKRLRDALENCVGEEDVYALLRFAFAWEQYEGDALGELL